MTETPAFEVLAGHPSEEELAALTVVIMGMAEAPMPAPQRGSSGWAAHWRSVGAAPAPGPASWTSTARR